MKKCGESHTSHPTPTPKCKALAAWPHGFAATRRKEILCLVPPDPPNNPNLYNSLIWVIYIFGSHEIPRSAFAPLWPVVIESVRPGKLHCQIIKKLHISVPTNIYILFALFVIQFFSRLRDVAKSNLDPGYVPFW